jgi:arginyl-tRNA synthetase
MADLFKELLKDVSFLVQCTADVFKEGLWILGIQAPEKM